MVIYFNTEINNNLKFGQQEVKTCGKETTDMTVRKSSIIPAPREYDNAFLRYPSHRKRDSVVIQLPEQPDKQAYSCRIICPVRLRSFSFNMIDTLDYIVRTEYNIK